MSRAGWIALLAIVILGGLIRGYAMERTFPVGLLGDERYYLNTALNIAQGRGHVFKKSSRLWRPPAHAYLLSRFVDPAVSLALDERGDPLDPLHQRQTLRTFLWVEVALSTLLVGLTGILGWGLFGARVGLVAAGVTAVYPNLIAYSHYLWSETLFAVLIAGGLSCVVFGARREGLGWAAGAGLLFGFAALTREIAAPIAAVSALWWVWIGERQARRVDLVRGALLVGVVALVVLPWTARNYSVHQRIVAVSSIGWFAAAQGNALEAKDWLLQDGPRHVRFEREYFDLPGEMERMDFAREQTFELVGSEQPGWIAKKALLNPTLLFTPDSYVLYKIRRGAYGELSGGALQAVQGVVIGSYMLVVIAAIAGFAAASGRGRRLLPALLFAVVGAVHVLANADTRFRIPWMPLFIVYGSYAIVHARSVWAGLRGGSAGFALIALGFFLGVCVPYFLWYGGRQ